ncbi:MAG: YjbQ family protein [Synechococcales cyanobacterium CRU_2_2]|nr:YjbQ family protein [Synechococcales cyanobacterium CRU_2_2]
MRQHQCTLNIQTPGQSLTDISRPVAAVVQEAGIQTGLCTVFLRHTSASLLIQENADPDVLKDLQQFLSRLVPEGAHYLHGAEGPDDMPAHIRTALTQTSETIPIAQGRLALGTWQGLYVWEHRQRSHSRELVVHVLGD